MKAWLWFAVVGLSGCNWMWVEGEADDVCVTAPMSFDVPATPQMDQPVELALPHLDLGDTKGVTATVELYSSELDSDRPLSELGEIDTVTLSLEPPAQLQAGVTSTGDGLPELTLLDFQQPPPASTKLALTQQGADVAQYFVAGKATARLQVKGAFNAGTWSPTVKACAKVTVRWQ